MSSQFSEYIRKEKDITNIFSSVENTISNLIKAGLYIEEPHKEYSEKQRKGQIHYFLLEGMRIKKIKYTSIDEDLISKVNYGVLSVIKKKNYIYKLIDTFWRLYDFKRDFGDIPKFVK